MGVTFGGVILLILGTLAFFAAIFGVGAAWFRFSEEGFTDSRIKDLAICLVVSVVGLLITSGLIYALATTIGGDGSDHCGPGTRYVSESHYNPATKTTVTDWMCVA